MPQPLNAEAVSRWCRFALAGLGQARESINAINVYPVADQDTGTNLYLTVESAAQAVEAGSTAEPTLAQAIRTMAHGALIGAHGNSGTILAQLLRGMADVLAIGPDPASAETLSQSLRHAVSEAYRAVAHPVEGTMLSVATGAARGASAVRAGRPLAEVTAAACDGARAALAETPRQLSVLARAGVVDAGGSGLLAVLEALDAAISGRPPAGTWRHELALGALPAPPPGATGPNPGGAADRGGPAPAAPPGPTPAPGGSGAADHGHGAGPGHEVIYLLDAPDAALPALRRRLDQLGDSLVVVGGDGLWNVHVHTDDPAAAVEAGIEAGRPHRLRISCFAPRPADPPQPGPAPPGHRAACRAVLTLTTGDGLARLYREAGATVLPVRAGEPPSSAELAAALRRLDAPEVVLLPNDDALRHPASAAADQVRASGIRVAVIPTRSPVQGIAALAVHAPERRFDEDVVAMTSAAGGTRFGELTVAERRSWTSAGICQAGDLLGLIDGDVAVIGASEPEVASAVLARMLSGGGELVTLVLGSGAPDGLAAQLADRIRGEYLGVDTVVCHGHQPGALLIGVE